MFFEDRVCNFIIIALLSLFGEDKQLLIYHHSSLVALIYAPLRFICSSQLLSSNRMERGQPLCESNAFLEWCVLVHRHLE